MAGELMEADSACISSPEAPAEFISKQRQLDEGEGQMPRGNKDGSMIRLSAVVAEGGKVVQPACVIVRKRYTDSKGRPRQKKRVARTMAEAQRLKRQIEREIEAELAGIGSDQAEAFCDLVDSLSLQHNRASHIATKMLLMLETSLRRNEKLLPEFRHVTLEAHCNAHRFEPAEFVAAIVRALENGLRRNEQLLHEQQNATVDLDASGHHFS
jgi:hypothetical protein